MACNKCNTIQIYCTFVEVWCLKAKYMIHIPKQLLILYMFLYFVFIFTKYFSTTVSLMTVKHTAKVMPSYGNVPCLALFLDVMNHHPTVLKAQAQNQEIKIIQFN